MAANTWVLKFMQHQTTFTRRHLLQAASAAAIAPTALVSQAQQAWPRKPIRLIVPFAAAGQSDLVARYIAKAVGDELQQSVVVENVTGATGMIGAAAAARAEPDGHTLVYTNAALIMANQFLFKTMPLQPLTDLTPVVQLGIPTHALVIRPTLKANTVAEFVRLAKQNPGGFNYGSWGTGSSIHIYGEMLQKLTGIQMTHVPFRGAAPALQELMAGRLDAMFVDYGTAAAFLKSQSVTPLAVVAPRRFPLMPDVPTFTEIGIPLDLVGWNGLHVPAKTPKEPIDQLAAMVVRLLKTADAKDKLLQYGLDATGVGPAEFASVIARDTPRWGKAIKDAGVEPQ